MWTIGISESGPITMALAYDPMGRLNTSTINGTQTTFLYDGDALVAEYQSGAITARYVHGPATDNPVIAFAGAAMTSANAAYLIADRQGSIVATANTSGAVTANQTYDAYGVPASWTGTRFRYTGQIAIPQAELYYYKARIYDPVQGHFLQTDPVGYGPDVNWYAYVGNDPVNHGDPSGTTCEDGQGPCSPAQLQQAQQNFQNYVKTQVEPTTNKQLATGAAAIIGAGAVAGAAIAAAPAVAEIVVTATRSAGAGEAGATAEAETPASTPIGRSGSPMNVRPGTNRPTTIGGRGYTGHGLDQMQGRGITPSPVEDAIQNGTTSPGNTPGTTVHTGENGITVVTGSNGQVITVIPKGN